MTQFKRVARPEDLAKTMRHAGGSPACYGIEEHPEFFIVYVLFKTAPEEVILDFDWTFDSHVSSLGFFCTRRFPRRHSHEDLFFDAKVQQMLAAWFPPGDQCDKCGPLDEAALFLGH